MTSSSNHPGKRLSPWRVLIGVLVVLVAVGAAAAVPWYLSAEQPKTQASTGPRWFGGYFDVTAVHGAAATTVDESVSDVVLLSFVVAKDPQTCDPAWGAAYSLDDAGMNLDLDRRIDRMRRGGSHVAVSFGGALNTELASACESVRDLEQAYEKVIDRYAVRTIDLDLEGVNLRDTAAGERRATAIASLQRAQKAAGGQLDVWVTLPVAVEGLTGEGVQAVEQLLAGGVNLTGVNLMTMDYGTDLDGDSMAEASIAALEAAQQQLTEVYAEQRIGLPKDGAWALMGATVMIGQNDVADEVFTLDDARELNVFAHEKKLARLSMWSLNRDRSCGSNYPDPRVVSDACSGVDQGESTFASALSRDFDPVPDDGRPAPKITLIPDDPETSPYPIWSSQLSYSSGVRVVWHGYVYAAKWWIQGGAEPDDPTVSGDQTAWVLVGPVTAEDEPFVLPTEPPGTYPAWDAKAVYEKGDRVLYAGTPYEAKWWTQAERPSDGIVDHDRSPWQVVGLSLEQKEE